MTAVDMTMHVDPSKRDIVVSRFDAEPRGTWDSEYADPQLERYLDEASRAPDWAAAALKSAYS